MSLRDRTVLVTRRREQAGEMVREIELRGGTAVVFPMITIGPPASWEKCDEAIARLGSFDALLFTSVNAVESFFGRASVLGVSAGEAARVRALAVGEKTAAAAAHYGAAVVLVPEKYSGESLAAAVGGSYANKRILLPRGDIARAALAEALRGMGAVVETVTVYVNTKPAGLAAESFVHRLLEDDFDVVTFASPSAAVNFGSLFDARDLNSVPDHASIAVIGPSTADAVRAIGLPVDVVARESTARGLVRCIDEYFS